MSDLTAMPGSFVAGSTMRYRKTLPDYSPGDGWALDVYLAGAKTKHVTATVDGEEYVVELNAAATAALVSGVYRWEERASKDGYVVIVAGGTTNVEPDIASATDGSMLSYEERAIPLLEALLLSRSTDGLASFSVTGAGGRAVQFSSFDEVRKELSRCRANLAVREGRNPFGPPMLATFPAVQ